MSGKLLNETVVILPRRFPESLWLSLSSLIESQYNVAETESHRPAPGLAASFLVILQGCRLRGVARMALGFANNAALFSVTELPQDY
ncbi:hypothetical protein ACFLZW_07060, partial [Chloroflexota bacterium]